MAACPSLSVTWPEEPGLSTTEAAVPGAPAQGQAAPTLSMDALRKLSSRRRASAREQELMTTDVSVESSSSWAREAEAAVTGAAPAHPPPPGLRLAGRRPRGHLGLLQLHDGGLAVGDAVVYVVDVGRQRLDLLRQLLQPLLLLGALRLQPVPFPAQRLLQDEQLLPFLGGGESSGRRPACPRLSPRPASRIPEHSRAGARSRGGPGGGGKRRSRRVAAGPGCSPP